MSRTKHSLGLHALAFILAAAAVTMATASADAAPVSYPEGQYYETIANPIRPAEPGKIVVQEFFWFGCPHCFVLEPLLEQWAPKLPAGVVFEHVPDSLGHPIGVAHQKAYYTAVALGVKDRIMMPLFDALQVQHARIDDQKALRKFFVANAGVTAEQFDSAWNGFSVDTHVRKADQLAMHDGILSVPTLVINGQYKLNAGLPGYRNVQGGEADHFRLMLRVADSLIARIQAEH